MLNLAFATEGTEIVSWTKCPVCGKTCNHPVAVGVNPAGNTKGVVIVDRDGVHLDSRPKSSQGVKIGIMFEGECGHRFALHFHFLKDGTMCYATVTQASE